MKIIDVVVNLLYEQQLTDIRQIISEAEEQVQLPDQTKKEIEDIGLVYGKGFSKWIIIKLTDKSLKPEDVYKYKNYFKYFEKGKKLGHFTYNDIFKYKSPKQFEQEAIESHNKHIGFQGETLEQDEKYLVSPAQIQTLQNVGILFLGVTPDGYQCFKIPKQLHGSREAFESYKNILGRCQGREKGAKIEICTIADFGHFNNYLKTDDYYLFFNMRDPRSPYQFHYNSEQFMDKNDHEV